MLAKIEKSLHIINKAYWHMICHSFYGDYLMQRKAKRGYRIATGLSPDRSPLTITSRAAGNRPFAGRRQSAPRMATFQRQPDALPGRFSPSH